MPKPYSLDLRERVFRYADEGHSCRAAAAHFGVSVSFVVNLVKAFRVRGSLTPSPAADAATPSSNRIGRFFWRSEKSSGSWRTGLARRHRTRKPAAMSSRAPRAVWLNSSARGASRTGICGR